MNDITFSFTNACFRKIQMYQLRIILKESLRENAKLSFWWKQLSGRLFMNFLQIFKTLIFQSDSWKRPHKEKIWFCYYYTMWYDTWSFKSSNLKIVCTAVPYLQYLKVLFIHCFLQQVPVSTLSIEGLFH